MNSVLVLVILIFLFTLKDNLYKTQEEFPSLSFYPDLFWSLTTKNTISKAGNRFYQLPAILRFKI